MVWFLVDDGLAFHPKVVEAGNSAMGLWVRAGSWCTQNLTDGYIPRRIARQLGEKRDADKLVRADMWTPLTAGSLQADSMARCRLTAWLACESLHASRSETLAYHFHDWDHLQQASEQVKQRREQARQRKERQRQRQDVTRDKADVTRDVTRDPTRARTDTNNQPASRVGVGLTNARAKAATSANGARGQQPDPFQQMADNEYPDCPLGCHLRDGYRENGTVCDHTDRTLTAKRGSKNLRETMGWNK